MSPTKLMSIITFCDDWHSGQWSRGYKLSCLARRRLRSYDTKHKTCYIDFKNNEIYSPIWIRNTNVYRTLENNHRNKV